jgi:HTH-type transcriptional regulator/antitoxin HigA
MLRQEMETRGWTQAEFAQRLDRSSSAISRLLSDRTPISPDMDWRLSLVLGTPQGHWLQLTYRWIAELRGYAVSSR